jgi:hypothetical protein
VYKNKIKLRCTKIGEIIIISILYPCYSLSVSTQHSHIFVYSFFEQIVPKNSQRSYLNKIIIIIIKEKKNQKIILLLLNDSLKILKKKNRLKACFIYCPPELENSSGLRNQYGHLELAQIVYCSAGLFSSKIHPHLTIFCIGA